LRTTCEHCIFKLNTGHTQTGCQLDRLVKYDAQLVGDHYEFEGYCNFVRNCYSEVALADDPVAAVKKECEVKYGVVYSYDEDFDKLAATLKSCSGFLDPVDFVVCFDDKIDVDIQELYNKARVILPNVIISQSVDDDMNWFNTYETAMKKIRADYVYFCECGEEIDKKCVSHLNSLINDEVKTVYMIVNEKFTIVYKKLFQQFAYLDQPMQKLYSQLTKSEKHKDTVIKWPNKDSR